MVGTYVFLNALETQFDNITTDGMFNFVLGFIIDSANFSNTLRTLLRWLDDGTHTEPLISHFLIDTYLVRHNKDILTTLDLA